MKSPRSIMSNWKSDYDQSSPVDVGDAVALSVHDAFGGETSNNMLKRRLLYQFLALPLSIAAGVKTHKYLSRGRSGGIDTNYFPAVAVGSVPLGIADSLAMYKNDEYRPSRRLGMKLGAVSSSMAKFDPLFSASQRVLHGNTPHTGAGQGFKERLKNLFTAPSAQTSEILHGVGGAALGGGLGYAGGEWIDADPKERLALLAAGALPGGLGAYALKRGLNTSRSTLLNSIREGKQIDYDDFSSLGHKGMRAQPEREFVGVSPDIFGGPPDVKSYKLRDFIDHFTHLSRFSGTTPKDNAALNALGTMAKSYREGAVGANAAGSTATKSRAEQLLQYIKETDPTLNTKKMRSMLHPDKTQHSGVSDPSLMEEAYKLLARNPDLKSKGVTIEDVAREIGKERAQIIDKKMRGFF